MKLSLNIFILLILTFSFLKHVCADTSHEGDIILTGNDVLIIKDTTYTQTGNIFIRDNARLSIKNSTFIFNQRYHDEFDIRVEGNGTFEVQNSTMKTGILLNENYDIYVSDEASVSISNSDLVEGYLILGAGYISADYKGSTTVSKSKIHFLVINFSSFGKTTLSLSDSEVNVVALYFSDYQGDFSDLRPGFFQYWTYKQGPFEITLENTNCGAWNMHCGPNSHIVVRNSELFEVGCQGLSTISLKVIDSIIERPIIHGFYDGYSVQLSNLRAGLHGQWSLQDHATGNGIPDIILENILITGGWTVSSFGANLSIDNSIMNCLRTYGNGQAQADDITSVSNSMIGLLMFYYSNATLAFDNTTIRDVSVYLPSNSIIEGNITFTYDASVIYWLDSTIKRIYPVYLTDRNGEPTSFARLYLYSKNNDLIWSGLTSHEGRSSFEVEFNDDNYIDTWRLVIEYSGESINKEIKFLSSTPILATLSGLNKPMSVMPWIPLLLLDD
jgi:hypothetical protein